MDVQTVTAEERLERRLRRGSMGVVLIAVLALTWRALNPSPPSPPAPPAAARVAPTEAAASPAAARVAPDARRLPRGVAAVSCSHTSDGDSPEAAFDGMVEYGPGGRRNRWATWGSGQPEDWLAWRFDEARQLGRLVVYYYTDQQETQTPAAVRVEYQDASGWRAVESLHQEPPQPRAGAANEVRFAPVRATDFRLVVVHQPGRASAITELRTD